MEWDGEKLGENKNESRYLHWIGAIVNLWRFRLAGPLKHRKSLYRGRKKRLYKIDHIMRFVALKKRN